MEAELRDLKDPMEVELQQHEFRTVLVADKTDKSWSRTPIQRWKWDVTSNNRFLLIGPTPASFTFIFVFSQQYRKSVASRIQTWIVGVEGKDLDHYTPTTAQKIEKIT